jgi:hypothetical protein
MRLSIPAEFRSAINFGDWTLYHLPLAPAGGSFLWQPFKLMLPPRSPIKWGQVRAYRLAWSPLERRFAKSNPVEHLRRAQPVLHDLVESHLHEHFGPDWLTGPAFYEQDEIDAELARLKERRTRRAAEARAAGRG